MTFPACSISRLLWASGRIVMAPPLASSRSSAATVATARLAAATSPNTTGRKRSAFRCMAFAFVQLPGLPWQPEGDDLAAITGAADRDDEVLLAVEHVRHRRAALRGGNVDRAHLFTGRLVERPQHGASGPARCRPKVGFAGDEERLRDECAG